MHAIWCVHWKIPQSNRKGQFAFSSQFSGPLLRKQTEEHTKRCGHVGTTQQRFPFLDGVVSFELRTHIYRGAAVTGQCLPPVRMAASLHETNSIILTVSPMIISLLL